MKCVIPFFALMFILNKPVYPQKSPSVPATQPYGVIDTADLKITTCDFEPGASAEILFDKGIISFESGRSMQRHIRIKILNDFGKGNANIRFVYHHKFLEGKGITGLEAETINLENNTIIFTPVDKHDIHIEK